MTTITLKDGRKLIVGMDELTKYADCIIAMDDIELDDGDCLELSVCESMGDVHTLGTTTINLPICKTVGKIDMDDTSMMALPICETTGDITLNGNGVRLYIPDRTQTGKIDCDDDHVFLKSAKLYSRTTD